MQKEKILLVNIALRMLIAIFFSLCYNGNKSNKQK